MAGPNAEQMAQIKYFTDLALEYGKVSNTFWNFHVVIAAAALGWAISSRNWKSGLPAISCVLFFVGYMVFTLIILYCEGILYERMNAAIRVAKQLWAATPIGPDMRPALDEIGAEHWPDRRTAGYTLGHFFSEGRLFIFGVNVAAAAVAAALLSPLGRKHEVA